MKICVRKKTKGKNKDWKRSRMTRPPSPCGLRPVEAHPPQRGSKLTNKESLKVVQKVHVEEGE